jgi:hypothetical protein
LKRIYLLAAIILIFGVTYAIEYYANSQFETQELVISGISGSERGVVQTFDYLKDDELVGSYSYKMEESGDQYIMMSETDVTSGEHVLELETVYTFDNLYKPEYYSLTATSNGEENEITTEITNGNITTSVTSAGVTVNFTDVYVDGMLLIENSMPGFWEVLFNSFEVERGVKYSASIYIPQAAMAFDVNLVVSKDDQLIWVGDERLECMAIGEANLDLGFYMYEGELVEMRSEGQGVVLRKILN